MSVIQTIRDKYTGLIIGGIVVALLGFLVMDGIGRKSGSLFGDDNTTVGEINGNTISTQAFEDKIKTAEENYKNRGEEYNEKVKEEINNGVWNELVNEIVMNAEYEKLGINITKKEMQDMLTGPYADDQVRQAFTNPETGIFDAAQVKASIANIKNEKDPLRKKNFAQFMEGLESSRKQQKYYAMLMGGIYSPKPLLDAKYDLTTQVAAISYATVPYTTVQDKDVPVTDEDLKKFIEKHPNDLKLEQDLRKAEYVVFDVIPTSKDTMITMGGLNMLKDTFITTADYTTFVNKNSSETFDDIFHKKGDSKNKMVDSMLNMNVGTVVGPYYDEGYYKYSRLVDKRVLPDSVRATHILIAITEQRNEEAAQKIADSVLKAIRGGADIAATAAALSDDNGSKTKGGDVGYFTRNKMVQEFEKYCFEGKTGQLDTVKTGFGYHIIQITDQKGFQTNVKVATLSKPLLPSQPTRDSIYALVSAFAREAKDAKSFDALVKGKYAARRREAQNISEMQSDINGLGSAREVVRWMFDAKVGDVSRIFSLENKKYVVAELKDVTKKGLISPAFARINGIEQQVRKEKKAAKIMADYKSATTLEAVAAKASSQVENADTVIFMGSMNPKFGTEPKVIGAAFNKAGMNKVTAIAGNSGVYYVTVKSISPNAANTMPKDYNQLRMMEQMNISQRLSSEIQNMLRKKADIKDNRAKFY